MVVLLHKPYLFPGFSMLEQQLMDFHQILIRTSLHLILQLTVINALEPILLYNVKQFLLKLDNLANQLAVELKYFILLALTFVLV